MAIKMLYALSLLVACGIVSALPVEDIGVTATATTGDLSGRGTIYYQYGAAGSCGAVHGDGDYIVALGPHYMKGPNSPYCGRRIFAKNTNTGKSVTVTVADTCPTCGPGDVDLALGPWKALTNNAAPGVFPVSWHFS
ncbi:Mrsp1 [Nannizzia gypsea CBS 118893]|uniref:Mrsp1 n=1 Tax=Arthroderma gypseum (strain ATCC MYA-4604 / CBS 118893) TaxID=535722 RepID=E4V2I3_ARTGP|nr:Mrsp1 [Nannizzia gypsea CBS 118893]EFR04248.1 Mrsp1 [Nannizzia gypsea CBS 118893]